MKKTISLIMALCLIAGLLYGCKSKRISAEDDTVSGLLGGFLYDTALRADTKAERDYNKSRSKAILSLMSSVNDAAAATYSINDGIADYEKHLLKFINKIDDPSNAESLYITNIMEKLTAYRVLLETYEEEARSYLQMKPDTGGSQAIIRSYAIGSINDLMVLQDECISFLTNRTGAIYNILIKTSKRQAENLISSSVTLYNKKISEKYVEAQSGIDNVAEIIRYISSADYYASIYYLEKADEGIGELKSGTAAEGVTTGMISDLEKIVFDLKNDSVPPAYLVPVPEGNTSSLFTRSVYAADEEAAPLDSAKSILTAVSDIESESESAPPQFEENLNDSAEKNSRIPARVNDSSYVSAKTSGKSFFSFLADKAGDAVNYIKDTGKDAGIRITIALAQQTIKKFNPDTDSRYAAIINTLISHLADSKAVRESNQVESVTSLIKKDLETLIGENKEAFVSYILTSKAEDLLVTFNDWKAGMEGGPGHVYTIKDMVDLLALIGIEASEIQNPDSQDIAISIIPPNTSPSDNSSSSSGTGSDSDSDTGTPSNDGNMEFFTHTRIIASYDQMIRLSSTESNARALEIIFGWTDPLVYGNYEKVEERDKDGNIIHVLYLDSEEKPAGWEVTVADGYVKYEYHFPGYDKDYIRIRRKGTFNNSTIFRIETGESLTLGSTDIYLRQPDDPESYENGVRISQKHAGVYDGLNTDDYLDTEDYSIWSKGKPVEFYSFENNIMTKSVIWEYVGGDEIRTDTFFYATGQIQKTDTYKNRQKDGVFLGYYENGNLRYRQEYKEDKLHGAYESYYENGRPKSIFTYENGEKSGLCITYFDNAAEQKESEYTIKNGKTDGIWYLYDESGRLLQQKAYKEGILDGPYLHNDYSSDYYRKGQYSDGRETGLWEHGTSEGWHYKVEYDANGRKIWDWYIEKGYITYYNEDGSVSHTEEQGQN